MKISKKWLVLTGLLLIIGLMLVGCVGEKNVEEKEIVLGKDSFTYDWVPTYILEHIATELGYTPKIVEGDVGFMWLGLSEGDIDIWANVWLPTIHKTYIEKYKDQVDLTGKLSEKNPIGWAVPTYVEDVNSIADLKGRGDEFNHRIVGFEPSAGMMLTSEETIQAYDLDYELIEGSTPTMLAEVERATKVKEPIVCLSWRPHTMIARYDLKILDDPKGIWVRDDWIIGTHPDLKEKAPDLYNFITNFKLTNDEVEKILFEFEEKGSEIEVLRQLTKQWIEDNREKVDGWLGK